jgi:hypothetical protein
MDCVETRADPLTATFRLADRHATIPAVQKRVGMMTISRTALAGALMVFGLAAAAHADDGLSAFKNGALVFGKSETIAMTDETLTISRSEITADFHFINNGKTAETITVAFPLPDIDTANDDGLYIPVEDNDNFVGFTTVVDGKPVVNGLEQRAFTPDGKDVTDLLKSSNVPLVRTYGTYLDLFATLPEPVLKKLADAGAVAGEQGDRSPKWITKSKFYFEQTFEPGKPVHIVHRYKPSLDTSNMSVYSGDMAPSPEQNALFCLNEKVKAAVVALEKTKANTQYPYAVQSSVSYVLETAKTWAGPIGHFHLIIDKEKPDVVASFCGSAKPTSPTRFEFQQDHFVPDRDLDVVMFE